MSRRLLVPKLPVLDVNAAEQESPASQAPKADFLAPKLCSQTCHPTQTVVTRDALCPVLWASGPAPGESRGLPRSALLRGASRCGRLCPPARPRRPGAAEGMNARDGALSPGAAGAPRASVSLGHPGDSLQGRHSFPASEAFVEGGSLSHGSRFPLWPGQSLTGTPGMGNRQDGTRKHDKDVQTWNDQRTPSKY